MNKIHKKWEIKKEHGFVAHIKRNHYKKSKICKLSGTNLNGNWVQIK